MQTKRVHTTSGGGAYRQRWSRRRRLWHTNTSADSHWVFLCWLAVSCPINVLQSSANGLQAQTDWNIRRAGRQDKRAGPGGSRTSSKLLQQPAPHAKSRTPHTTLTANTLPMKPPVWVPAAVLRTCSEWVWCGLAERVAGVSRPESCREGHAGAVVYREVHSRQSSGSTGAQRPVSMRRRLTGPTAPLLPPTHLQTTTPRPLLTSV